MIGKHPIWRALRSIRGRMGVVAMCGAAASTAAAQTPLPILSGVEPIESLPALQVPKTPTPPQVIVQIRRDEVALPPPVMAPIPQAPTQPNGPVIPQSKAPVPNAVSRAFGPTVPVELPAPPYTTIHTSRPLVSATTPGAPVLVAQPTAMHGHGQQPRETLPAPATKSVPISLDAVLHLAQEQNGQVRIAREKLQEAYLEHEIAHKCWLPDISIGAGYWRHEGGIQDFRGELIRSNYGSILFGAELRGKLDFREAVFQKLNAERRVWHQQGELSKFTAEQLLDAATTYVDFLAARAAEAVALDLEAKLARLLEQARNLEKVDQGVRVETMRVEGELNGQKILSSKFREVAAGAAAKLIFLLGLDPDSQLVPLDQQLVAFRLVDASQPVGTLIETALHRGPGVLEMNAVLDVIEETRTKGEGKLSLAPTLEVFMTEGAFGAGPGARTDWANRWDFGVQARFNLTELLNSKHRRALANSKIQQAHLSYQELRGKLTLGVQEAREATISGQEQVALATKQIDNADESYRLSDMRLRENVKGRSPSEVLLAIRALVGARLSYVHALRDQDKAQLRLFILTGGATTTRP